MQQGEQSVTIRQEHFGQGMQKDKTPNVTFPPTASAAHRKQHAQVQCLRLLCDWQPQINKQTQHCKPAGGQGCSMAAVGAQQTVMHLCATQVKTYSADEVAGDVEQLAPAESGEWPW